MTKPSKKKPANAGKGAAAKASTQAKTKNSAKHKRKPLTRLDQLQQMVTRKGGASIAEMSETTGWQQHSVRGALAGALKKKRGLTISSEKIDGVRRYQAEAPSQ